MPVYWLLVLFAITKLNGWYKCINILINEEKLNSAQTSGPPKKTYPAEVYLNGKWLPHNEAFISVFDRGFMLGDGIYEVIPFYKGKAFGLQRHLDRLTYCLKEIEVDLNVNDLREVISEAVSRAGIEEKDGAVYIQVTRGVAPRTHYYPQDATPTVLIYGYPVQLEGFENKQASVLVSKDLRWHRCDIKSISLMANIRANNKAHAMGLDENILVRKGFFTEGSHSSIFFVKFDKVYTHPEGPHILSGITRKIVTEMCKELNIKVVEKAVHIDELVEVDEIFLTGTTTQILSVKTMYKKEEDIYNNPKKGKITSKLQEAFIELTRNSS